MKNYFILLTFLFCGSMVQAQNPFEQFGYSPKIGTLSKGKYIEHFDNDSIVRIGSVLFNTNTNTVSAFAETDTIYSESKLDPTVISRWMNPDPLADEFPSWSPYNFVYNNPIRYTDPTGLAPEDLVIWFKDENGNQQSFTYTGNNGNDAPENAFVNAVLEAACNNCTNGDGKNLQAIAENSDIKINVSETDGYSKATPGNIYWNSDLGTETDNGTVMSPATVLEHEADHALHRATKPEEHRKLKDSPDSNYTNLEEKRVITGSEQRTARANGEISANQVTRTNHKGEAVITTGTTSNKVDRQRTYNFYKRINRTTPYNVDKQLKKYKPKN